MFKSGQLIKAKVDSLPFIIHYGITIVENNKVYILHNTPFYNTIIDPFDNWIKTRKIISIQNTKLTDISNKNIIEKFKKICFKKYNLLNYNCEHFIDCMLDNKNKSEQINNWFLSGIIILICLKKI